MGQVSRHSMGAKRERRSPRVAPISLACPPSAIRYLEDPLCSSSGSTMSRLL